MTRSYLAAYLVLVLLVGGALFANAQTSGDPSSNLPAIDFGREFGDLPVIKREGVAGRAFGDPSSGCYSSIFRLPVPDDAGIEKIIQSFRDSLTTSDLETRDLQASDPTYSGATSIKFKGNLASARVDGIATLSISSVGARRASLLSCYWNQRLPTHCQTVCETSLQNYYQSNQ